MSFGLQIEATHAAVAEARRRARRLLDDALVPPAVADDIELVIGELASNAVEQQPDVAVRLDVSVTCFAVQVTVTNETTSPAGLELPPEGSGGPAGDPLSERGRGLPIVRALTDDLWVETKGRWTSVSCQRRFDQASG